MPWNNGGPGPWGKPSGSGGDGDKKPTPGPWGIEGRIRGATAMVAGSVLIRIVVRDALAVRSAAVVDRSVVAAVPLAVVTSRISTG